MKADRTIGLYAGSFDPITRGHLNIITKALQTFDEVHIGIGVNSKKTRLFSVEESIEMIREQIGYEGSRCSVGGFTGKSITQYAREIEATHIVRGLRQASDFNDEFVIRGAIEQMDPSLVITHFICDHQLLHVSSSTARELASVKANIGWLVTPNVELALLKKFE